jgi:FkbM family methyltransferase
MRAFVRRLLRHAGFELRRHHNTRLGQLVGLLRTQDVNMVLDVGANEGQFASEVRGGGFSGAIVSFEPLSAAHERLEARSRGDTRWAVPPRIAIGKEDGHAVINVAANSVSSSLRPMLKSHRSAAPKSAYVGTEPVPLGRLESAAAAYVGPSDRILLKIDTQGTEDDVLRGSGVLLEQTVGIYLELSLVPLYDGQVLFPEMKERLEEMGYSLWAMWPGFVDPRSCRMLQVDACFFKS